MRDNSMRLPLAKEDTQMNKRKARCGARKQIWISSGQWKIITCNRKIGHAELHKDAEEGSFSWYNK